MESFSKALAGPPLIATADEDAISSGARPNLVPKLLPERRNNGDDPHRFFVSFVLVSLGWCSLVFT